MDQLLDLRTLRRRAPQGNEAQHYGGLGGLVLEGLPGVGKSECVIACLIARGFHKQKNYLTPAVHDNSLYRMPVSMSLSEKEALLLKAFDEGAVVITDEINTVTMMEHLLNGLFMGLSSELKRPKKPGLMIIATQNPITMAGRRAPSTALARRLATRIVPEYTHEELKLILEHYRLPDADISALIQIYQKQKDFAAINRLSPAPTFRDLLKVAKERLLAQQEEPHRHAPIEEEEGDEKEDEQLVQIEKAYKELMRLRVNATGRPFSPRFFEPGQPEHISMKLLIQKIEESIAYSTNPANSEFRLSLGQYLQGIHKLLPEDNYVEFRRELEQTNCFTPPIKVRG